MRKFMLLGAALSTFSFPAIANDALMVENPHAYESVAAVKAAGVFVTVHNHGAADDVLLSASTDRAEKTELHTIIDEDGVKKMRAVESFPVPANGALTLARGGDHIMLFGVADPLKAGETFPLTLTFENAGTIQTTVKVQAQGEQSGHAGHHGHH